MTNSVDNQEVIIFEISYENEDNLELRSENVVIEKEPQSVTFCRVDD